MAAPGFKSVKSTRNWILVVDDDPEMRELLIMRIQMLVGNEVQIIQATDGLDACNRLPFTAFDLIFTDLKMPKKEGQAFIASARQSLLNQGTPIIVVTGHPDPRIEKEHPFIYQVAKPVDFDALNKIIDSQLKLGRTDERIAADLLNGFIEAVRGFFEQVLKTTTEQKNPIGKKKGDAIQAEYLRIVDFKSGKAKGQFVVGFSENILNAAQKAVNEAGDTDYLKVVENAGRIIFQRALRKIGNPTSLVVTKAQNVKNDGQIEVKKLQDEAGILIPMETPLGAVQIYTLW